MSLAQATEPRIRSPLQPERCYRAITVDLDANVLESSLGKTFEQSLVERTAFWQKADL